MNLPLKLRAQAHAPRHVLVTGANGHVGSLVVATLLRSTGARVTALVRPGHALDAMVGRVATAWERQGGGRWSAVVERRLAWRTLPADPSDLPDLAPELADVDEIVHAAGCLEYQHRARLQAANVVLTAHLALLARRLTATRLVLISSAFAGGYTDASVPEGPLPEPGADPNLYTASKRAAERLVAAAGVPFLVLRPSVLIGHSEDGSYTGGRHGLVQQWASLTELGLDGPGGRGASAPMHVVATDAPVNLLHEDAFCAGFAAARRWLPDGAYAHLVSDEGQAPTMRALWGLWFEHSRPAAVAWYPRLDDVPLRQLPAAQRAYLSFARLNLAIAAHRWRFDTGWLALLRERGLVMVEATLDSVRRCQQAHVAGGSRGQVRAQAARRAA